MLSLFLTQAVSYSQFVAVKELRGAQSWVLQFRPLSIKILSVNCTKCPLKILFFMKISLA